MILEMLILNKLLVNKNGSFICDTVMYCFKDEKIQNCIL